MHDEEVYLRAYRALQSGEENRTRKRSLVPRTTFGQISVGIAVLFTFVTVIGLFSRFAYEAETGVGSGTAAPPKAADLATNARNIPDRIPAAVPSLPVIPRDKSISNGVRPAPDPDHAISLKRPESHSKSDQPRIESRNWEGIKNSGNLADLQAFLRQYPAGPHVHAAAEAIQKLQWDALDKQNSSSLQAYLDKNEQSPYSAEARQRLAALLQTQRARAEEVAWNSVDPAAVGTVRQFLAQYPNGGHAVAAQELLLRFSQQEEARKLNVADDSAWTLVSTGDRHSLEQYLNEFPSGRHTGQAQQWLSEISSAAESRDASAVVATLKRYSDAWNAKDLADITALRPGVGRRAAKEELSSIRSIVMRIQPTSVPKIEGDRATVECIHQVKQVFDDGTEKQTPGVRMTYFLVKRGGNWLIAESR